jgi:benzoyl-CoA reductase/2-hydroxyglutaryl-CoA dehydratase subunit BcrC/BadD/HgdB
MKIGITTTIPIEPVFASGNVPYDLNNMFISSKNPAKYIEFAEEVGYPSTVCSWIKGLYSVAIQENMDLVVGVVRGDCSNTGSLLETLESKNIKTYPFSYPYPKNSSSLKREIEKLMHFLKVTHIQIDQILPKIELARRLAWKMDEITYKENKIHSEENHAYLVSTSDFKSDLDLYIKTIKELIENAKDRAPIPHSIRLGYIGVPPIFLDIYKFLEKNKAYVVFNEVQRQFSMPYPDLNWSDRYLKYTFPYSIFDRIKDIKKEIEKRKIDGLIHYVQSFCHRQITDLVLRENIDVPILTVEGNQPINLDERTKIRLESFIDMLL